MLTEHTIKYLVGVKNAWNENCKVCDEVEERRKNGESVINSDYDVDVISIKNKAADLTFNNAIITAHKLGIISEDYREQLHAFRKQRNNLIHELYLFDERNNSQVMKTKLIEAKDIVIELVIYFERLVFDEIGVDTDEVLETLYAKY